jgi:hypothetical protein
MKIARNKFNLTIVKGESVMKNWTTNVFAVLFFLSVCFVSPTLAGEGGPPGGNQKLTGPSTTAIIGLKDRCTLAPCDPNVVGCKTCDPNTGWGYVIDGYLLITCQGKEFNIPFPGFLLGMVRNLTNGEYPLGLIYVHIPTSPVCNPKPSQEYIIVDVKRFFNAGDVVLAEVTLMILESK